MVLANVLGVRPKFILTLIWKSTPSSNVGDVRLSYLASLTQALEGREFYEYRTNIAELQMSILL